MTLQNKMNKSKYSLEGLVSLLLTKLYQLLPKFISQDKWCGMWVILSIVAVFGCQ